MSLASVQSDLTNEKMWLNVNLNVLTDESRETYCISNLITKREVRSCYDFLFSKTKDGASTTFINMILSKIGSAILYIGE